MTAAVRGSVLSHLTGSPRFAFFLLFLSFLVTFVLTRAITRMIRAGRGPFRNNISGGVHIHHSVPGIILTVVGAFTSVAARGATPGAEVSAVLIGVGSSLVLDEFALILHLQDVYWSPQGQLSVQLVALALAGLGLGLIGINPVTSRTGLQPGHLLLLGSLPVHLLTLLVCVAKGKYSTAVVGAFLPPVAWVGAVRLARPGSRWSRRRYGPDREQKAVRRARTVDARFGSWGLTIADLVAGKPTERTEPTSHGPGKQTRPHGSPG